MPEESPTLCDFSSLKAESKSWYTQWWGVMLIFVGLLLGSFAVAFGFAIYHEVKQAEMRPTSIIATLPKVDNAEQASSNYALGATSSMITIVEFSDFACQYSKRQYPVLRQLALKYPRLIRFVYRDYPILSEHSIVLARAGRCAGEQSLFWPMHDYLFDHQGLATQEDIIAAAKNVGVQTKPFAQCMEEERYTAQISADYSVGKKLDLEGTPAIFINNYRLPAGEIPANILESIINELQN